VTIRNELIVTGPVALYLFGAPLARGGTEVIGPHVVNMRGVPTTSIPAGSADRVSALQLMFEMSDASKNHCDVVFVAGCNHFGVAH
jgi:hypothetical protein